MGEKRETAMDRLSAKVNEAFASVEKLATPGVIKAWVKESLHKRIDYSVARNLQNRLKRARVGVTLPKTAPTAPEPAGQMRHKASHGV